MCVGQALLPLRVDESKYSFRSYFRPVGPCKPLRDTSPKSKIQPRVKPMETAGFDRIITDSHNDWILSHTQTVPSSTVIVIGWLVIACLNVFHWVNTILKCFPHNKTWSAVFACSVGEGWYISQFFLGMCRWPPTTPRLYSKIKFACILVHFFQCITQWFLKVD